ncbi:HD domain-containing protein, partial [Streptomyces aidingensis]
MPTPFKALLIGVPVYEDDALSNLPCVGTDLQELEAALRTTGYEVDVHDVEKTDMDSLDQAVERILQEATEGQTILIYLSGHGIHHNGTDCLVPGGARTRSRNFRNRCLSLDFSEYVTHSRAGNVIVFVDACREGVTLQEMSGVGNARAWSTMQVLRVGNRHYCHVYACSPGEYARYVITPTGSFSLFSRALSTLVAAEDGPRTLSELGRALQDSLDELTAKHGCPRQQIRIRTESKPEPDEWVLFPRPERSVSAWSADEHPWAALAREHPAWQLAADGPGKEPLRDAAVAFTTRLAEQWEADAQLLSADPWHPAGFAERTTDRVSWLLTRVLNPEKLKLSSAEAALLVVLPFLYVAHGGRRAARSLALGADPENLRPTAEPTAERARYEQFFGSHPRLVRRWERITGDGTQGIAWWLYHRWFSRQPLDNREPALRELTRLATPPECPVQSPEQRLVAEALAPDTLTGLLRSLRSAPGRIPTGPPRHLAGASVLEQQVRDRLLAGLLTVAHRLAIDPTLLPEVVVDHLGIWYSVDLPGLHRTLEGARWEPRGRTRVLHATCTHPAVELALRQQTAALDALLGTLDAQGSGEPQWEPLQDLPVHASAEGVRAALTAAGKPEYESTDLRFRLADDRVQELLMGEQLYGDPALAIRELYQNALDACRYRDARTAFLRRRSAYGRPWAGSITFTQGQENGRPYIECRDNGIGMGEHELREVFSRAGMRFADLPEFLEEQAAWREEGISLYPNSQFGIGVLSYFMIADDIRVTTCRLDREGRPGEELRVDIAGPGALFKIQRLGRGEEAGTAVRLFLRSADRAPSCVGLLRRLLWISDYSVNATDPTGSQKWEPGVLSESAPLDAADPAADHARRGPGIRVAAGSRPQLWWCSRGGGILADGLWAGIPRFGAVVNLDGPHTPRLSVDRRKALNHDRAYVDDLLHREIPALLRPDAPVLDHAWVSQLVAHDPRLADEVLLRAVAERRTPWVVGKRNLDVTAVGCFTEDAPEYATGDLEHLSSLPPGLQEWRHLAWVKAGAFPGVLAVAPEEVPLARPTDAVLLSVSRYPVSRPGRQRTTGDWLPRGEAVPVGHVYRVAKQTGYTPA